MTILLKALKEASEFYDWIGINTNNLSVPNREKDKTAMKILQQSMDLGDAILLLLNHNLPGPAFTIARPHFETYVCGVWLFDIASPNEISAYLSGITPKIDTLVKKISKIYPETHSWRKKNKELNLRSFHGLAHSGAEHVIRRASDDGGSIEPNYKEEEIIQLIKHCTTVQIGIAVYTLLIADKPERMQNLDERISKLGLTFP